MILILGKVRACFSPRWSQSASYLCKCRGKLFRRWWRFTERKRLETETHPIYSSSSPTPIFFRSIYPSSSPTPICFPISIFFPSSPLPPIPYSSRSKVPLPYFQHFHPLLRSFQSYWFNPYSQVNMFQSLNSKLSNGVHRAPKWVGPHPPATDKYSYKYAWPAPYMFVWNQTYKI